LKCGVRHGPRRVQGFDLGLGEQVYGWVPVVSDFSLGRWTWGSPTAAAQESAEGYVP
jgi:hypothetical protein